MLTDWDRVCDGSGQNPDHCYVTVPHEHCVCGLPMDRGLLSCGVCALERARVSDGRPRPPALAALEMALARSRSKARVF